MDVNWTTSARNIILTLKYRPILVYIYTQNVEKYHRWLLSYVWWLLEKKCLQKVIEKIYTKTMCKKNQMHFFSIALKRAARDHISSWFNKRMLKAFAYHNFSVGACRLWSCWVSKVTCKHTNTHILEWIFSLRRSRINQFVAVGNTRLFVLWLFSFIAHC